LSPPPTHDPLAEGLGWRELEPAPPEEDRWPFRPPLTTRRGAEVRSLAPAVWEAAVAKAQAVYRRTGVRSGTPEAPQWTAARGRRWIRMEAERIGAGGVLAVEYERPSPRPWLLAVSLLCWPTAVVGVTVLLARPAALMDWAVVGGLLVVPVAIGAVIAAVEWVETLHAGWRAWRVLRAVRRAARPAPTVWVAAAEVEELEMVDAPDTEPALLPEHLTPSQWLSTEEMEQLDDEAAVAPGRGPTLVWPSEAPRRESALVWPVEVQAPHDEAEDAFRDLPFAASMPLQPAAERSRGDGVARRPRGDGVVAEGAHLPQLTAIHLSEIEAVPEPVGGDGLAGPPPELGMGRRPPQRAEPRPPESRVLGPDPRAAGPAPERPAEAPPSGPVDVFTEWHPPPPWAWQ